MAGNALCEVALRLRAAGLHDGARPRADCGPARDTVGKWLDTYRSAGIEVLAMMERKHTAYPFETKVAAVSAVVDGGMTKPEAMAKFGIASPSSFRRWLKAYRGKALRRSGRSPRGGRRALAPRPGRRCASRDSSGGSGSSRPRTPT